MKNTQFRDKATTAGAGHGSDVTITGPKDSQIETKTTLC